MPARRGPDAAPEFGVPPPPPSLVHGAGRLRERVGTVTRHPPASLELFPRAIFPHGPEVWKGGGAERPARAAGVPLEQTEGSAAGQFQASGVPETTVHALRRGEPQFGALGRSGCVGAGRSLDGLRLVRAARAEDRVELGPRRILAALDLLDDRIHGRDGADLDERIDRVEHPQGHVRAGRAALRVERCRHDPVSERRPMRSLPCDVRIGRGGSLVRRPDAVVGAVGPTLDSL